MTEEEAWLAEKMNLCATLIEDFCNIYENQLFILCRQAIFSDEYLLIREISCTKVNILLDLKRARLDLEKLRELVCNLYTEYNSFSSNRDLEKERALSQQRMRFSREVELYQLLNHLIQLTNLEYDKEYESTVYKKMMDCIFSSIKNNHVNEPINDLTDVKAFFHGLTEKEIGELIVEHFTINYSRNQGLFFDGLSSGLENYVHKSSIFANVMQSLEKEFRSLSLEDKIKKLKSIYQTDFYKKQILDSTLGTK